MHYGKMIFLRFRKSARAADRARLESVCTRNGTVGSNPTFSVSFPGAVMKKRSPNELEVEFLGVEQKSKLLDSREFYGENVEVWLNGTLTEKGCYRLQWYFGFWSEESKKNVSKAAQEVEDFVTATAEKYLGFGEWAERWDGHGRESGHWKLS